MVNITINGTNYEVPEGYTVLKAATENGIHIPTLCDHPELTPYGGCRLCLVEVDGFRTPQPSCTLPVSNNMVIRTDTPAIHESRKFVLSLIFSERNHFCPYCQVSGGDCELQNNAYDEGMTYWPIQPNWKNFPVDASHPYIILEHNRCILCRRCVRACGELVGNFTLGIEERGANSILMADLGVPLGESTCISCGTCVQVCPTGALIDRWSAYRGREEESKSQKTICTACSVGCGIEVFTRNNNIVKIYGDWDSSINKGVICSKGRFLPMVEKRERVLTPIVKQDGKPKAATWHNALEAVSARWSKGEVAALVSDRLPAETLSLVSDLIGSEMVSVIESNGDPASGIKKPFEGKLADLKKADCVVVVGTNLIEDHEVVGFFIKRLVPNGASVILVDSESNPLDQVADVVLKPAKGGEAALLQVLAEGKATEVAAKAAELLAKASNPVFIYGDSAAELTVKALVEAAQKFQGVILGTRGGANSLLTAFLGMEKEAQLEKAKAVLVLLADDEPSQKIIHQLEKVPFKAVMASYHSQLSAQADVVLPVAMWAEESGTFISMDGHVQQAVASVNAPEEVKSSKEAVQELATKLGVKIKGESWKELLKSKSVITEIVEA